MPYTQETRRIAVATPLGTDVLLLSGFTGSEGVSELFQFGLDMVSENDALSFQDLVGQNATVRVTLADGAARYFNGYISRFSQGGHDHDFTYYHAEIVPWVWFLTRTSDCRIFQEKKVPDIIGQIFTDHGFQDYKLKLFGSFTPREYCVQYRETDFNFISRLMEEEGIFYYFQHENGKHTLVLANSAVAVEDCPKQESVRYELTAGGWQADDVITEFRLQHELRPDRYSQSDYNFETPSTRLNSSAGGKGTYELYDYHPGEYKTRAAGDSLARIRLEEAGATGMVVHASSDCRAFTSGYQFKLKDHYRPDLNQAYILTSIHHTARQGGDYRSGNDESFYYNNRFECIPAAVPLRPSRITPHPVVHGAQTAVVVGPAGEEIYADKYGRIKVQFHWDREGKDNENSSCWVRVAQLWAGKNWGSIFIPRIGQEVIVDFLEGDPDQPIVTGRVYNAEQMPPYALPGEATKSTFKTYSSKGGGGFNEIRFEDKKGDEQIFIHSEKNLDIRVKNDEYKTIEKDLHLVVEQNHFEHVKNGRNITIDNDLSEKIGSDHHKEVTGKEAVKVGGTLSLKVDGNVAESFGQGHSEQVSMSYSLKAMNIVLESDVGITLKCGSNSIVIDPVGVTLKGTLLVLDGVMTMINSGPGSPPTPGTPGVLVPPLAPKPANDADKADPGEMAMIKHEQIQQQKGKYGAVKLKPFKPETGPPDPTKKKTWIEIQLKDEAGKPVPGEAYSILLPDGSAAEGSLDEKGFARVDGIDPGTAKITFPNLDKDTWEPA